MLYHIKTQTNIESQLTKLWLLNVNLEWFQGPKLTDINCIELSKSWYDKHEKTLE